MALHADDVLRLDRFQRHLVAGAFSRARIADHLDHIESFLMYLRACGMSPEVVTEGDLTRYLRAERRRFRDRHGHGPRSGSWARREAMGIRRFLAHVQGRWPPPRPWVSDVEEWDRVVANYARWLRDEGVLLDASIALHCADAGRLLSSLPSADPRRTLAELTVPMLDRYLRGRTAGMQRSTARGHCVRLRRFLTFLHSAGLVPQDLAGSVLAPTRYRGEGIPSALAPEHVEALLAAARQERLPTGRRDYAMLMLLATYGMRAKEVRHLRLDDLDWRGERLLIRHAKTGHLTWVPLLADVGDALLAYLRHARPACADREVFIRATPPRGPIATSSALNSMLRRRLAALGLTPLGKHGPHSLRHARAISLQRAGVPLKTIGDLLGHRSFSSTAEYLKLAEPELRAIALPLPGVSP